MKNTNDDTLDFPELKMDDFKPICKRCGKGIIWGQEMGKKSGVDGEYFFHEYPADCGINQHWFKPKESKYQDD